MVTAAPSITGWSARPEPDCAPELTVDALVARMRLAAECTASSAAATRALMTTAAMVRCMRGNSSSFKSIQPGPRRCDQHYQALSEAIARLCPPTQEKQPVADLTPRLEALAAQVDGWPSGSIKAIATLNAADQTHGTLIDAGSVCLETLCQENQATVEQIHDELAAAGHRGHGHLPLPLAR